jgi:chitin disaccharide deacetylase
MTASLAERLGYGPDERLLIVNCDDLGASHAANAAIEHALRSSFATSATLMVPAPWAYEAVQRCGDLDVGVHLTLTAEYPGYRWRSLTGARSLHDADGFMPATTREVYANADVEEARAECRAQIEQALAWGVDVTHLDSHMGSVQTDPRFYAVYLDLAAEYDLPLRMAGKSGERAMGFPCRQPASDRGVLYPDYLVSPPWPDPTRLVVERLLASLRPGVSEIYLHPALDGPELRAYDPENSRIRAGDDANFNDAALRQMVEGSGVTLIGYRPLRDMQRAEAAAIA